MKFIISSIVLILLVVGAWYVIERIQSNVPQERTNTLVAAVSYSCDAGKTIQASYYEGEPEPAESAGIPPTSGGSVALVLADGRTFTLPQTLSGSGVRYATADDSFVFWNKSHGVSVAETGKVAYTCVEIAQDTGGLSQVYVDSTNGFTIRYPGGYVLDSSHDYQMLGPGTSIKGVKFTIDSQIATGTNLSSDSYVSVEKLPSTALCAADAFLESATSSTVTTVTENSTAYSYATRDGAGAGNRYEESVYALPGTNPCIAVRYFIHYGAIENYPEGEVKEFNKQVLIDQFDSIRRTLIIGQQ